MCDYLNICRNVARWDAREERNQEKVDGFWLLWGILNENKKQKQKKKQKKKKQKKKKIKEKNWFKLSFLFELATDKRKAEVSNSGS